MMRALTPEINDLLFNMIKDRLPEPPVHRYGGCRRRIPDDICFYGLFKRFITGEAWESIEHTINKFSPITVSDTTLRARRTEWVNAGVFHQLMEDCLAILNDLEGLDFEHVAVDGSTQLAPGGGPDTHNAPGSKGRKTFKWCIAIEANGIVVGEVITKGSANDYPLLEPTLDQATARDWITTIGTLHLDRGFGYPSLGDKLDHRQIDNVNVQMRNQPHEGRVPLVGLGAIRWKVERTNAWLTNFRQLKINWDRTTEHRTAAVHLACAILTLYRIVDHLKANNIPLESIR